MKIDQSDIDIDNFIKEKINSRHFRQLIVEPSPDFGQRTMDRIYRLEWRKRVTWGLVILWIFSPLTLRQLWLLVRNDYFSASRLPFGNTIVGAYYLFLSLKGEFLLLAMGIFVSLLFVFKLRRDELSSSPDSPKVA
jgi:hypothetical protein